MRFYTARTHQKMSLLTSELTLNTAQRTRRVPIPDDAECQDRFEHITSAKKWSAYQKNSWESF